MYAAEVRAKGWDTKGGYNTMCGSDKTPKLPSNELAPDWEAV